MVASGGTPGATTFWRGDHAVAEVGVGTVLWGCSSLFGYSVVSVKVKTERKEKGSCIGKAVSANGPFFCVIQTT